MKTSTNIIFIGNGHTMGKFIITEEEKKHIMGLYESTVEKSPNEDEWCKTHVKDTTKQICIVKTPNSGDQSTCQKMTGSVARQKGYMTHIVSDVSEQNFCRSVWEKM